jgi:hypothetical protein
MQRLCMQSLCMNGDNAPALLKRRCINKNNVTQNKKSQLLLVDFLNYTLIILNFHHISIGYSIV